MILKQIKHTAVQFPNLRKTLFGKYLIAFTLLLPILFAASCAESSSDTADKKGGVTANQIIENPSAYVGKTVTVSGDVEEIHGPRAFSMDSGASIGELLVVGREPFPNLPEAGDRVYVINDVATVSGVIRLLDGNKIKDEIGWDLDPNLLSEYNGKPVLVVTKAEFRPGKASTGSNSDANMNKTAATDDNDVRTKTDGNGVEPMTDDKGKMADGDNLTDIGVYAKAADKMMFVGKKADFTNARVVRVVGPRTFTVASGNDEVYVMLDDESARGVGTQGKIDVGNMVNVAGTFERLQIDEIKDIKSNRFRALTATERAFLEKAKIFLQANKVSGSK